MLYKIIKIISLVLIVATLGVLLFVPHPVSAGDGDPRDEDPLCGSFNEWYAIYGTQDASGAYIGSATLYIATTCPFVGTLNFIVDGHRYVYELDANNAAHHTITDGGVHTVIFFFDTGGGGVWYGPFDVAVNIYRPPSIRCSVVCSRLGQNGWCVGNETLSLTASDPQGKAVKISGSVAGTPFTCPDGPTCSFPLPNGSGMIKYLVRSATTLTDNGSTSWALDNTAPQINGSLNGTSGNNNWFISNTTVSASAVDGASGLAVFEYSLDNAAYTAYTAPISLSDGTHTLTFRAVDLAGNQNATTQSISVDTTTPVMDISLSGTAGLNGWYISDVLVTASANDPGSGLASLEYAVDGGAWTSYTGALTLTDGARSLSVRAMDVAGNVTQSDQQIHVDTTTPLINLSVNGTQGAAGWYVSDIQVSGASSDSNSGLASFEYTVDGGAWTAYTSPLLFSEGQRNVQFRATDQAGNATITPPQAYLVDTSTPSLNLALSGMPGMNGWYKSNVQATTSANDSVSGLASLEYAIDGGGWRTYTSALTLQDGIHTLGLRAFDVAGNIIQEDQKIFVDATTPLIKLSVSGTQGVAGWYVSDIKVNASSTDNGSGLASLEYSFNDGAWTAYTGYLPYSEGQHNIKFRATDQAGNMTITPAQTYFVDKTPPVIDLSDVLKPGVTENYEISDAGSGVGGVRVVIHDGQERYPKVAWGDGELAASFTGEIFWDGRFADGMVAPAGDYYVTVKAHDQAGNESETTSTITVENSLLTYLILPYVPPSVATPILQTTPPAVPPTEASFGGEIITEPAVPPVVPQKSETLTTGPVTTQSTNFPTTNILWGAIAAAALGAVAADAIRKKEKETASSFGGEANHGIPADAQTRMVTSGGLTAIASATGSTIPVLNVVEAFTAEPVTNLPTNTPTTPGILWGTAAVSAIGTFLSNAIAEQRKKWEEEKEAKDELLRQQLEEAEAAKAARIAIRRAGEEGGGGMTYKQIGEAYQASLKAFKEDLMRDGLSEEQANSLKDQAVKNGSISSVAEAARDAVARSQKQADRRQAEEKRDAQLELDYLEKQAEKQFNEWLLTGKNPPPGYEDVTAQERQAMYQLTPEYQARMEAQKGDAAEKAYQDFRTKEQEVYITPPKEEKSWWQKAWDKTWDWAFNKQTELSLGTGIVAGVAAVALVVTGVITAPAWLVIGGVVLATAALVTAGTLALNAHFGLSLGNNLGNNLLAGTVAAVVTTGAGLLLASAAPGVATTIAGICTNYSTACSQVGTIIDKGEEALLAGQVAYYTWIGDQDKAAEAALQLQLEQLDGDIPGNSVANELGEQIDKLGPDALEIAEKYGDDAIPLLAKYGDDAVDIIGAYGDNGIALLLKYGDNADEAIDLVKQFGTPAVKVLDAVDLKSAKALLTLLDGKSLDYAIEQGPGAIKALSYWPDDFLVKYGDELVLRVKDDTKVLEAAAKLAKLKNLNTKEAQDLIDTIAYNSIQGGGSRLVLGTWVPGTLDEGFIGVARSEGALFYGTNPGLDKILSESTDLSQEDLFWAVNNRVLEISVEHDFKIDYSLKGLDLDSMQNEINAMNAIAFGKSREEVSAYFGGRFPFRMREVEVLIKNGYKFEVDITTNMVHWIKP